VIESDYITSALTYIANYLLVDVLYCFLLTVLVPQYDFWDLRDIV